MTLFELARELFTYLVRFREKASSTAAPPLPEVRRDLLGIFARMDNQAKRDPLLMEPYHQVHYALVGLADEVVLTSGWEHSTAWRQALLEERFYNSQEAGSRFFELASNLDQAPQDVVAIFYLCLALGFSGRYAPADPELAEVKEKLLARLPSKPRIMEEPPSLRSQQDRRMRGWLWGAAVAALVVAAAALGWEEWQDYKAAKLIKPAAPVAKTAQEAAPAKPKATVSAKAETDQKPAAPAPAQASPQARPETVVTAEPAAEPASAASSQPEAQMAQAEAPAAKPPAIETQPKQAMQAEAAKQPAEPPQAQPEAPAAPPAASQEQAAAAASAPPQKPEAAQAPKPAPAQRTYRVRVGVYVGPIQSGRFADALQKAGFPASVEKLDRPGGKVLYVVSITPLANLDEAQQIRAAVKDKFKVDGVIKQN